MQKIDELVGGFLNLKKIAVVGVSDRRDTGCNASYQRFKKAGYTVFAINPRIQVFAGDVCYPDLRSLPEKPDGVFILANPSVTESIVQQCVELGVRYVWMHCLLGTKAGLGASMTSVSPAAVENAARTWNHRDSWILPQSVSRSGCRSRIHAPAVARARVPSGELTHTPMVRGRWPAPGASTFPTYGSIGLALVLVFWAVNWTLPGPRTHWSFFPLWLGYCLTVDALVVSRTGTSLFARGRLRYMGLFLVSAPAWWLFEAINLRTQNWVYLGADSFRPFAYAFWTTLSFATVLPAVFESAELMASFAWVGRLPRGPRLQPTPAATGTFFVAGLLTLGLLLAWPGWFFPFAWLSMFFILEPINIWLGNRNLAEWTSKPDWRPVYVLWLGVLVTAFFWELWNFHSFPKWIYHVPWGDGPRLFEMPLLGYGGYLPFALELYALYHFVAGFLRGRRSDYVHIAPLTDRSAPSAG